MVTGQHPADLLQENLKLCFEPYVQMSPAFSRWLRKMTEPSQDRRFTSASVAQQALDRLEDIPAPNTPTQLQGTHIVLTKTEERLEVIIPGSGISLFQISFAIGMNSFIALCFGVVVMGKIPFPTLLFPLLVLLIMLGQNLNEIFEILFALFGKLSLSIDQRTLIRNFELFGFRLNRPRPLASREITKIEFYERRRLEFGSEEPRVVIWVGRYPCELAANLPLWQTWVPLALEDPELEWLAAELSQWTGLPIERKKPKREES